MYRVIYATIPMNTVRKAALAFLKEIQALTQQA